MQYGIYYAYWETEWGGNFVPYVEKCARLGFDVLEVACGAFDRENDAFFHELAAAARANGMALTGGSEKSSLFNINFQLKIRCSEGR